MAQLDIALIGDNLYIEDLFDAAIQELDLLMNTEETELLGDPKYGTNFETFLWTLNPMEYEVQEYIDRKINLHTYFCRMLSIHTNVKVQEGTQRDIYIIEINFKDNIRPGNTGQEKTQTYSFR